MPGSFHFISADPGSGKTAPAQQKAVRSHCMRGRNKREDSRRSLRAARQASRLVAAVTIAEPITPPPSPSRLKATPVIEGDETPISTNEPLSVVSRPSLRGLPLLLDAKLGEVASQVDLTGSELIFNFETFNRLKKFIFPTYEIVAFGQMDQTSSQWISRDVVFACAVLTLNSLVVSPRSGSQPGVSKPLRYYLLRTIALLNEQLSRGVGQLEPNRAHAVIYIITVLANVAYELGDYAETGVHVAGLVKILQLMGGRHPGSLQDTVPLRFELERLDMMYVLGTGNPPNFITFDSGIESASSDPVFEVLEAAPGTAKAERDTELHFASDFAERIEDARLAAAYQDLWRVAAAANECAARGKRLPGAPFQRAISAVRARLLLLRGSLRDIADECLRLGLLAFLSAAAFRSPGSHAHPHVRAYGPSRPRMHAASHLRVACCALEASDPHLRRLLLWALTVGAVSVFEVDQEPWLAGAWGHVARAWEGVGEDRDRRHPRLLSWEEARADLGRVLWIGRVLDEPGRKLHARLAAAVAASTPSPGAVWGQELGVQR